MPAFFLRRQLMSPGINMEIDNPPGCCGGNDGATGNGRKGGDNILYFKYHVLLRAKVSKLDRKTTNKGFFCLEWSILAIRFDLLLLAR